ncbi:hypothetical protein VTK56DRAFT_875 [Thermocarpiscus australiensis]
MEQVKALNALEPFLALSKSATSPRAAADLIVRATSAPNTYIFTELLQTPQIQALASSEEFAPYLTLLQIFSYGTYSSYASAAGLPALNDAQRLKLRQLSLLTLARKDDNVNHNAGSSPALGYASLQQALDLPSRQALEELVISAIYAGLLKAQLNPKESLVQINSVAPLRDVAPTAIGGLLSSLQAWAGRCEATLQSLEAQMNEVRAAANRRAARAAARAAETDRLVEGEQKGGKASSSSSSSAAAAAAAATAAPAVRSSLRHKNHINSLDPLHDPFSLDRGDEAGNGGSNNINTNKMDSMLTVGGGSSFLAPGGSGIGAGAGAAPPSPLKSAIKRDSGQMDGSADGSADAGAMDTDDEDDSDGKMRASKKKLKE